MQGRPAIQVCLFHEVREVEDVALCAAAETLENPFVQIRRERWRIFLSIVIRQRTVAVMLVALALDLDTVVFEHGGEVETSAERLEVYPVRFHSVVLR